MTQEQNQSQSTPDTIFPDEKNTPIVPKTRRTGQGARQSDVREGAEPEAPGNKNMDVQGDPNQGTESR
jgi:photosystem I subunit 4